MRNLTNSFTKKMRDNRPEQSILDSAEPLVEEFERLLASEIHLLSRGISDGLESIALAKQSLIEKLSGMEASLIDLIERRSSEPRVEVLKERLRNCRIENKNNHALVMMELKHSKKSLDLLRSVLDMDDLSLYSERGEVDIKREKRKFGSA